jgi:predicted CXXCH cytochrome family protein
MEGGKGMAVRLALLAVAVVLLACTPVFSDEPLPGIKKDCKTCHKLGRNGTSVELKLPISRLCLDCHPDRKAPVEHVVDIKPTLSVRILPLDRKGMMTCITCHEPHGMTGNMKMLRATPSEICAYCHDK